MNERKIEIETCMASAPRSHADRLLRLEQLEVLRCAVYQIDDSLHGKGRGLILGPGDMAALVTKRQEAMDKIGIIVKQIMDDVSSGRGETPGSRLEPS